VAGKRFPLTIDSPSFRQDRAALPAAGRIVSAIAPVIISASRATDIPAFYGDWFMDRLRKGYVRWRNPFGGRDQYVSFKKTRLVVFWSKNPGPFIRHLPALLEAGLSYYFLYTLNDYEKEGIEPHLPPLDDRIATFLELSARLGKGRVIWRSDPLFLSDSLSVSDLLERTRNTGERIHPYCRRMVISFIDIEKYGRVKKNLRSHGFGDVREFTNEEMYEYAVGLSGLNRKWGLEITTCGEACDLLAYGIGRGQCIGYDIITDEFSGDTELLAFLHGSTPGSGPGLPGTREGVMHRLKDPGQRSRCGCIVAKDIGQYGTCPHGCLYCYANSSPESALNNYQRHIRDLEISGFSDSILG
jgi:DNA repair photolyase